MSSWKELQAKKTKMQQEIIATLTAEQREVLTKVLELEWDNRHLKVAPDIKGKLRQFIQIAVNEEGGE